MCLHLYFISTIVIIYTKICQATCAKKTVFSFVAKTYCLLSGVVEQGAYCSALAHCLRMVSINSWRTPAAYILELQQSGRHEWSNARAHLNARAAYGPPYGVPYARASWRLYNGHKTSTRDIALLAERVTVWREIHLLTPPGSAIPVDRRGTDPRAKPIAIGGRNYWRHLRRFALPTHAWQRWDTFKPLLSTPPPLLWDSARAVYYR